MAITPPDNLDLTKALSHTPQIDRYRIGLVATATR